MNFCKVHISKIMVKTRAWLIYAETISSYGILTDNFCNRLLLFCANLEINAFLVFKRPHQLVLFESITSMQHQQCCQISTTISL